MKEQHRMMWKDIKNWFRVGDKAVQAILGKPISEEVVPKDPLLILHNPHQVNWSDEEKRRIEQEALRDAGGRMWG